MDRACPAVRVVLIDDHPIFRSGVRSLLHEAEGIEVVGEAGDGRHGLDLIRRTAPDVAVVDLFMADMSGLAVARALNEAGCRARVVFLTLNEEPAVVDVALATGARGYVLKRSAGDRLLEAIRAVQRGGCYVDAEIGQTFHGHVPSDPGRDRRIANAPIPGEHAPGAPIPGSEARAEEASAALPHPEEAGSLTAREHEVLRSIAFGMTMKEVSLTMSISVASVDTYKIRACKKLGLRSRASIVRYAIQRGWLDSDERAPLFEEESGGVPTVHGPAGPRRHLVNGA